MRARRRGSTMVEAALATTLFLILLIGLAECALLAYTASSVTYSARRATRWASIRGSASGHPAAASDIQAQAKSALVLDLSSVTVNVTWTPDNKPGSTVQVQVSCRFPVAFVPLSRSGAITIRSTARQVIIQ